MFGYFGSFTMGESYMGGAWIPIWYGCTTKMLQEFNAP